ncbi:microfibril-associated glycoprotein 4-like [Uranotaenia lowii]|uniref:microfibril-associated glycoprotein 4-like n=1 Tax=Uranotaenia lowii TaxID=190385 RepID=UPI002479981A|nr:microfibril-associated glycoprotein 4-like [Uranotaenia lowii]
MLIRRIKTLLLALILCSSVTEISCSIGYEILGASLDIMNSYLKNVTQVLSELHQTYQNDMGELRRKVENTEQIVGNIEKRIQSLGKDIKTEPQNENDKRKGTLQTCFDVRNFQSRIYQLQPQNLSLRSFKALCDNDYSDGGWTVIQNRFNGSVNFYRGWKDYEEGCGDLEGEFWLGLEKIHQLTSFKRHELHVLLEDVEGNSKVAQYDDFRVADKAEMYTLESIGKYNGTAGDSLHFHRGEKFSTFDSDPARSFAKDFGGAWWHHSLFQTQSNLNGKYRSDMYWSNSDYTRYFVKSSRMMIRVKV